VVQFKYISEFSAVER